MAEPSQSDGDWTVYAILGGIVLTIFGVTLSKTLFTVGWSAMWSDGWPIAPAKMLTRGVGDGPLPVVEYEYEVGGQTLRGSCVRLPEPIPEDRIALALRPADQVHYDPQLPNRSVIFPVSHRQRLMVWIGLLSTAIGPVFSIVTFRRALRRASRGVGNSKNLEPPIAVKHELNSRLP